MVRFSTSTAYYLAAVTFLGAVALPVSMDLAATQLSAPDQMAQAGSSTTTPGKAPTHATRASVQRGTPAERVEMHIKELHSQLKITPDQEDKWNAFAQVMRENAQSMQSQIEERAKNQQSMSALDDLNSYGQLTQAHADAVKRLVPAFEDLYNSMTPEQKKNTDMVFARYGHQMTARNGMSGAHASGAPKPQTQTQ